MQFKLGSAFALVFVLAGCSPGGYQGGTFGTTGMIGGDDKDDGHLRTHVEEIHIYTSHSPQYLSGVENNAIPSQFVMPREDESIGRVDLRAVTGACPDANADVLNPGHFPINLGSANFACNESSEGEVRCVAKKKLDSLKLTLNSSYCVRAFVYRDGGYHPGEYSYIMAYGQRNTGDSAVFEIHTGVVGNVRGARRSF
jgi:hypothetical protein